VLALKERHADRFIVNGVQYYHRYRNIEVLVEAVGHLLAEGHSDLLLLLSVDPSEEPPFSQRLVERVQRPPLRQAVLNFGRVTLAEVHALYEQSDLAVFPSLAESFSNAYLVAMQHGLPIVASDLDFAHAVLGEAALYFNYRDAGDLAEKIALLKREPDLQWHLSEVARSRVKEFTWERTYQAFIEAIADAVETP
jgi:glycosyltransferase involved in cell wall biosynthesis